MGKNTSVNFPTGVGARGSSGVAGVVKSTAGALTYVDAAYSIQNKFQFALIRNRAGGSPLRACAASRRALAAAEPGDQPRAAEDRRPAEERGQAAYPISTFTYVIVPTRSGDKAADLRKFIYWTVTAGQRFGRRCTSCPCRRR